LRSIRRKDGRKPADPEAFTAARLTGLLDRKSGVNVVSVFNGEQRTERCPVGCPT
jgi:hypothetical protein